MSRTVNLTSAGVATTKMACENKNNPSQVYNYQLEVISALQKMVGERVEQYRTRATTKVLKDSDALISLAGKSITARIPREDLKGKLAMCIQTWAIIGWNMGTTQSPVIQYSLTELLVDVVLSSGGHDGRETMASATYKAVHPVTGVSHHLTQPSDVTGFTRTCGCVAKQRGALGRTLDFGVAGNGTSKHRPSTIASARILSIIEATRDNANGVKIAKNGVSYELQHDASTREAPGIRAKYQLK